TLPSEHHPYFEVEDFGVGLNHEEMIEIYTVYGLSTKTNSKNEIGALGIGSKSPFCYAKTFSVIARKDGVERLYNCYIGSDGNPKLNKLHERSTQEGSGVKIIVPVTSTSDYQKFINESRFILSFFDPLPEIK